MDDSRRRHPARRATDRADVPQRWSVPRRTAVGQPCAGAQDDDTTLSIDHTRLARLLTSDDGGALIRLISGDIAGYTGPGVTHTPIAYAHVTLAPGAQLAVPWNPAFSTFGYVLTGRGTVGPEARPVEDGDFVVLGPGDHVVITAADRQAEPLDALLLGGLPIHTPIARSGPFVINAREEILQAIED